MVKDANPTRGPTHTLEEVGEAEKLAFNSGFLERDGMVIIARYGVNGIVAMFLPSRDLSMLLGFLTCTGPRGWYEKGCIIVIMRRRRRSYAARGPWI